MMPSSETNCQAPTLLMLILLLRSGMLANKPSQEMVDASVRPEMAENPQALGLALLPDSSRAVIPGIVGAFFARLGWQSAHANPCCTDVLIVRTYRQRITGACGRTYARR